MQGRKILIIEDDKALLSTICNLLLYEGFEVFSADNGVRGIEVANEIIPDLIVSDIMMPKVSGLDVLEALKKNETTSLIPFIFLTAKAELPDIRKGMSIGADDYITKPFDNDDLIQSINLRLDKQKSIGNAAIRSLKDEKKSKFYEEKIGKLTNREIETLKLLCKGLSVTKISENLGISFHTADSHRKNIKKKLEAKNIADIVRIALENGLNESL